MMLSLRFGNVRLVLLLVVTVQWFMFTYAKVTHSKVTMRGN